MQTNIYHTHMRKSVGPEDQALNFGEALWRTTMSPPSPAKGQAATVASLRLRPAACFHHQNRVTHPHDPTADSDARTDRHRYPPAHRKPAPQALSINSPKSDAHTSVRVRRTRWNSGAPYTLEAIFRPLHVVLANLRRSADVLDNKRER